MPHHLTVEVDKIFPVDITLTDVNTQDVYTFDKEGTRTEYPSGTYDVEIKVKSLWDSYTIQSAKLSFGGVENLTISSDGKKAYLNNWSSVDFTTLKIELVMLINASIQSDHFDKIDVSLTDTTTHDVYKFKTKTLDYPDSNYDVLVQAKEGYKIASAEILSGGVTKLNINDDETQATKNEWVASNHATFKIEVVEQQPEKNVVGFNHLYLVNKKIMENLSSERFVSGSGVDVPVNDLGVNIINVLELPLPIKKDIKGKETKIMLGNKIMETKAVELTQDEISLNIGKIDVPAKYNNSYDFVNTESYLHLPFAQTIDLDINYTIQQTINVVYHIDLYTGGTTINIKSSKLNGEIIKNESVKIGKSIPFIRDNAELEGELNTTNGINNKLYNAFIEVVRSTPYETDNIFNDDMLLQTKLKNETGYVVVNNGVIRSNASSQEKDDIMSILTSGVYIK